MYTFEILTRGMVTIYGYKWVKFEANPFEGMGSTGNWSIFDNPINVSRHLIIFRSLNVYCDFFINSRGPFWTKCWKNVN